MNVDPNGERLAKLMRKFLIQIVTKPYRVLDKSGFALLEKNFIKNTEAKGKSSGKQLVLDQLKAIKILIELSTLVHTRGVPWICTLACV